MLVRGNRGRPDGRDAHEVGGEHHVLAAMAVCQRGGEGSHRGRGRQADRRERADGGHPAVLVGEDGDRDRVGVASGHRSGECQLDSPDVAVREDPAKCVQGLADPGRDGHAHRAENLSI